MVTTDVSGDEPLSFAAVAGSWSGWASEPALGNNFWVDALLDSSAREGFAVGGVEYRNSEDDPVACAGTWSALAVQGDSVFTVREVITLAPDECPDGIVVLTVRGDSLRYEFTPAGGTSESPLYAEGLLGR